MKTTSKRNNNFILALTDEQSEKLKQLARRNDHAPSKQAYIIIRNYLDNIYLQDEHGNDIIKI